MATVYKVEIEMVSAWTNYTPEQVEKKVKEAIEKIEVFDSSIFENIEVKVERKA